MNSEQCDKHSVGDEQESSDGIQIPKSVVQPVTVHSSLDAIAAVCDEVRAMDLQTPPEKLPKRNQTSVLRNPRIWVPTPKTGVPALTTSSDGAAPATIDSDDRMLHPRIFKQIQKLCNHTFTMDACANSNGDNALCPRYCSSEDTFLSKDLKGEFVWINPPFKRANEFLEAYFAQKREYPDQVGACILLPCWR